MDIDWAGFAEVFVVSFAAAIGVMVLFALAVTLLSPSDRGAHKASADPAAGHSGAGPVARSSAGMLSSVIALLCFLTCAAVIVYGLSIIVR